jgi:hypothetical protein
MSHHDLPTSARLAIAHDGRARRRRLVTRARWAGVVFGATALVTFIATLTQPGV